MMVKDYAISSFFINVRFRNFVLMFKSQQLSWIANQDNHSSVSPFWRTISFITIITITIIIDLFQDYHSGCVTILEDMVKQLKWVLSNYINHIKPDTHTLHIVMLCMLKDILHQTGEIFDTLYSYSHVL